MVTLNNDERAGLDASIRRIKELLKKELQATTLCETSIPAANLCNDCHVYSMCRKVIVGWEWRIHDVTKRLVVDDRGFMEEAKQAFGKLQESIFKAARKSGPSFKCGDENLVAYLREPWSSRLRLCVW